MTLKTKYFFPIFLFVSCQSKQTKDYPLVIPIDPDKIVIVNSVDDHGKKQGLWQEDDTIHHRIAKEYNYKDDLLDGYYLVYKFDSPDTLTFGFYKVGRKHGEWKYWDTSLNSLIRVEVYDNDVLKRTQRY